ncbi:Hypothetical protein MIP_03476 [Mycobacterium intracellulare subsp. intracellulare MTCC 9506]|uniref:Uncharacterized protein n=1 Tax=Mycobacterium indicus pranii (strain DSM 45239 / MTCC 9506) TaxID=1232724 RepID=J9WB43_MYCIP|nr:Hypothetical protein MIP_03476 [Mycobacterium intracellulare subsp. intracellulare MTCC 9506]ETZ30177.1 hypothetical protein L842_2524 [Mycobacterium intracellulare MIN_052511_1280]
MKVDRIASYFSATRSTVSWCGVVRCAITESDRHRVTPMLIISVRPRS